MTRSLFALSGWFALIYWAASDFGPLVGMGL